jgi:ornithine cyclodeaminase/alanine dehydrogenase-like protein (mu-crystallin family)
MATRFLTSNDCIQLAERDKIVPMLREAFRAYSLERTHFTHRWRAVLPTDGATLVPGILPIIMKVNAKSPNQHIAIRGTILLRDLETGESLVIQLYPTATDTRFLVRDLSMQQAGGS